MHKILVIFNGIAFHTHLMEQVLVRARVNGSAVHAVFMRGREDKKEGYVFPSDLDTVNSLTTSEDALADDTKIINHEVKLANTMANSEGIAFTSQVIIDCRLDQLVAIAAEFDLIFMDGRFDDSTQGMLTSDRFSTQKFINSVSSPVEVISEV